MAKFTTEDFIIKARKVHGEKYDYSKAKYINCKTTIIIICQIHGAFETLPTNHLKGCNCPKCSGVYKPTTKEFIKEAKAIHSNKYDYSKVKYLNAYTKIIIICPEHGEFQQTPTGHLSGKGCAKCAGVGKSTTKEFIQKAKTIHGNKYDYSKVEYVDAKTKIIIICPEHGEFEQTPNSHLMGSGCAKCKFDELGNRTRKTVEIFFKEAKAVHGDKYDYSKVIYKHGEKKIIIICPEHGEFEQTPTGHLIGHGCPKCSGLYKKTTKEYIQKAKETHGDKYDYSKVVYVNSNTKVIIICPEHGEFEQEARLHLIGAGCQKCSGSYMDTKYFIQKAKAIHGDKYDYSKTNYIDATTNVIIICPEHGEFEQRHSHHLNGIGCPKCAGRGFIYLSVNEAMKIVGKLGLKTKEDYFKWWDDNKEYCQKIGLPKGLITYYKTY
jgi:hypothetical protein